MQGIRFTVASGPYSITVRDDDPPVSRSSVVAAVRLAQWDRLARSQAGQGAHVVRTSEILAAARSMES